jgi:argininosuccinate lyase
VREKKARLKNTCSSIVVLLLSKVLVEEGAQRFSMVKRQKRERSMKIDALWGSRFGKRPAEGLLAFTAGRDMQHTQPYDERLIPYDLWGSKAHAIMLWKQKVISKKDVRTIVKGLDEIESSYRKGKFIVDPTKEDVHSIIESYLIEHYGMESVGKLHTGRSRNDQVAVDMRLYLRAEMLNFGVLLIKLIDTLTGVAKKHVDTLMPGYTHHQPAMITSWGHLLFSYALSLERDVKRLINWYTLFNYNPLGGAAGYGTRLPLDRDLTARLLGFDSVHESSLEPLQNRWEPETELCYGIVIMMNHLSTMAQTLIVLSTAEFAMVQLDDAYCTGSSLMPQKKNPDPLEVIKGKAAYAQGMVVALLSMGKSLFTGYNRDSQWSKYPVMDVIDECKPALAVMEGIIASLSFNKEVAVRCCERAFITATDVVEWLVQKHSLPFREAKVVVEKAVVYSEQEGRERITFKALKRALREMKITVNCKEKDLMSCQMPERVLQARKARGGPAPEAAPEAVRTEMKQFQQTIKQHTAWLKKKIDHAEQARREITKISTSLR